MATVASNLVLGPAVLYVAAAGSAEPLDSAITPNGVTTPPGSPWTDVGGTDGGVTFAVTGTYTDLIVDQTIMPVGSRLTDLLMEVTTKLSEQTLANLQTALNGICALATGSGYETSDITITSVATQPAYSGLIIDGWAPFLSTGAPARRRIIVRKVLSQPKVNWVYDRKNQQSLDVTFKAFVVSTSVNPVHIVDQQA